MLKSLFTDIIKSLTRGDKARLSLLLLKSISVSQMPQGSPGLHSHAHYDVSVRALPPLPPKALRNQRGQPGDWLVLVLFSFLNQVGTGDVTYLIAMEEVNSEIKA